MGTTLAISFKIGGPGPAAFVRRATEKVDQDVDDSLKLAAMEGLDVMETVMLTEDRIDKGIMVSGASMDSRGSNQYNRQYRFGWLKDPEDYFLYQEEGFWHWGAGKSIEGILALKQGHDAATRAAEIAIDGIMSGAR